MSFMLFNGDCLVIGCLFMAFSLFYCLSLKILMVKL